MKPRDFEQLLKEGERMGLFDDSSNSASKCLGIKPSAESKKMRLYNLVSSLIFKTHTVFGLPGPTETEVVAKSHKFLEDNSNFLLTTHWSDLSNLEKAEAIIGCWLANFAYRKCAKSMKYVVINENNLIGIINKTIAKSFSLNFDINRTLAYFIFDGFCEGFYNPNWYFVKLRCLPDQDRDLYETMAICLLLLIKNKKMESRI